MSRQGYLEHTKREVGVERQVGHLECGRCGSRQIRRSRRSRSERLILFLLLPYRSLNCHDRFYMRRTFGAKGMKGSK